jgi:hypothetical protein
MLCAAIGRRLGYPLRLVRTHDHLFVRWEGLIGERFNIECTTPGFVSYSDDYYRTCSAMTVSDSDVADGHLLQNFRAYEELGFLLDQRAICLGYNLLLEEAEEAAFTPSGWRLGVCKSICTGTRSSRCAD